MNKYPQREVLEGPEQAEAVLKHFIPGKLYKCRQESTSWVLQDGNMLRGQRPFYIPAGSLFLVLEVIIKFSVHKEPCYFDLKLLYLDNVLWFKFYDLNPLPKIYQKVIVDRKHL